MPSEKPTKQTEAQLRERRVERAYKSVFGVEGNRTTAQELVWEDMERRSRIFLPVHAPQGPVDVNLGLINEGKRRFHLGTLSRIKAPAVIEIPNPTGKQE